jgi:hypothetical protein
MKWIENPKLTRCGVQIRISGGKKNGSRKERKDMTQRMQREGIENALLTRCGVHTQ